MNRSPEELQQALELKARVDVISAMTTFIEAWGLVFLLRGRACCFQPAIDDWVAFFLQDQRLIHMSLP
mgnify:CR=1 FL=1